MKEYHAHLKKKSFTLGKDRKEKDFDGLLKSFIQFMNNYGLSVNVPLLIRKVKENKPSTVSESDNTIKLRIRSFLKKENYVLRKATHVAQKKEYDPMVLNFSLKGRTVHLKSII